MADRNRLVLITGASAGIGRAACGLFAAGGDRVVGLARRVERLRALDRELGGEPGFRAIAGDVADAESMGRATARILDEIGLPDVIVANAGIGLDALFEHTGDDALRRLFEVNVFGVYRTIRPFLPAMRRRGSGRLLLVSSIVGKRGMPYYSAYSASKFALHGAAEALRVELLGSGVSVGLICPPSTESEFEAARMREGPGQNRRRLRKLSAETVAGVIVAMAGSRRREVVVSPEAKALALAAKVAPGLVDRLLGRMLGRGRVETDS